MGNTRLNAHRLACEYVGPLPIPAQPGSADPQRLGSLRRTNGFRTPRLCHA
jgi:hypothetical protein